MLVDRDDAVLTETMERIRRAELACVLYPPGTPEHARAVERLDQATRQLRRLSAATPAHEAAQGGRAEWRGPGAPARGEPDTEDGPAD